MKKDKIYKWNLREYIAVVSIATLIYSLFICGIVGLIGMKIFYHGEITYALIVIFCISVCVASLIMSGYFIWVGSGHLTKPLVEVTNIAKQVAEGNFNVKINRRKVDKKGYKYTNEIDELAQNINKMVAELDGMDYMRKDFISNVSHEIKTPIAAITGFTEILLDNEMPLDKQREFLEIINNESMRISRLCENMISMSKLDSQVIVPNKYDVRLDEQIRKCIILLREKWSDQDIEFNVNLESITIKSDGDMLQQVWINLIDNAIKYSNETCEINISAVDLNDDMIEVKVKDNGIGINKDKLNKIFDKFYQCEESHKKSGNGLGLSITKRIIELLNGNIKYESREGSGTIVSVTLPKS